TDERRDHVVSNRSISHAFGRGHQQAVDHEIDAWLGGYALEHELLDPDILYFTLYRQDAVDQRQGREMPPQLEARVGRERPRDVFEQRLLDGALGSIVLSAHPRAPVWRGVPTGNSPATIVITRGCS